MFRRFAALLSIVLLLPLSLTAGDGVCEGVHAVDAAMTHGEPDAGVDSLTEMPEHASPGAPAHGDCDSPAPSDGCASLPGCGITVLPSIPLFAAGAPPGADAARPAAPLAPPSPVRAPELPPPRA